MKFICDSHRKIYTSDPQAALQFWNKSLRMAREKVLLAQWGEASVIYGNAYEAAEILLGGDNCDKRAMTRYLQTATEFGYVLRKNTCVNELGLLVASVRNQLGRTLPVAQVEAHLQPLAALTTRSEFKVTQGIELALHMELGRSHTLH